MNIKQLKQIISSLPDDMDVMISQSNDESIYSMSDQASVQGVQFQDPDIPKKEWPTIECLVITDL